AQLGQLPLLRARQLCRAAVLIDISPTHPVPQTRLADPQILSHLSHPFITLPSQLDSTMTEPSRMWRSTETSSLLTSSHLRSNDRATGPSSAPAARHATGHPAPRPLHAQTDPATGPPSDATPRPAPRHPVSADPQPTTTRSAPAWRSWPAHPDC